MVTRWLPKHIADLFISAFEATICTDIDRLYLYASKVRAINERLGWVALGFESEGEDVNITRKRKVRSRVRHLATCLGYKGVSQ